MSAIEKAKEAQEKEKGRKLGTREVYKIRRFIKFEILNKLSEESKTQLINFYNKCQKEGVKDEFLKTIFFDPLVYELEELIKKGKPNKDLDETVYGITDYFDGLYIQHDPEGSWFDRG